MEVTVYLHTILQRPMAGGWQRKLPVALCPGSNVGDLLAMLEIPLPAEDILLVVNGRTAGLDRELAAGDEVHVVPAIAGGAH